ncbi:MAG: InlB B-repeat-containing protein, partial [Clostridia bacterium]|nr:InlB B-repeat-containing protein [Clostridia bacterium]
STFTMPAYDVYNTAQATGIVITLDYKDGVTPKEEIYTYKKEELPTPTREGYRFLGWYTSENAIGSKEIIAFTNPNTTYPWTQDENGVWSSGNKRVRSSTSNMLSEEFTVGEDGGVLTFEWKSYGESYSDYLGYDILNVETGTYLSGKTSPTYSSCLKNLRVNSSSSFRRVPWLFNALLRKKRRFRAISHYGAHPYGAPFLFYK